MTGINDTKIWAVVPAAGIGQRMASELPKQYLPLAGKRVIEHALERIASVEGVQSVVVALQDNDHIWQTVNLPQGVEVVTATGGEQRCHSVYNGLLDLHGLAHDEDWVLVHDAARPCVRVDDIEKLLNVIQGHRVGGLLALKITDTVKRGDDSARAIETVDRSRLWRALTPQVFRYGLLREALREVIDNGEAVTDEAQAVERLGYQPLLVEGSADNLKITTPLDMAIAALYLQQQEQPSN